MKAALLKAAKEIVLEEIPVPEISDEEALVEVKYCGICGTDVATYKVPEFFQPGTFLGHEFSGVIAKVGKNVKGFNVGDRVTATPMYQCGECDACKHGLPNLCERMMEGIGCAVGTEYAGAFAKYVRVPIPEKRLYHLPDEVSFEEGALVEPLATSLHAVRISNFRTGDYAMVLGVGGIGLGVIAFLKHGGAGLIIATEISEKRIELAKKIGADYVVNPQRVSDLKAEILKLTDGKGVDQVFVCTPAPQAFQSAANLLKYRGQVVLIGLMTQEVPITPVNINMGELNIQGSLIYTDEYPIVLDLLKRGALPVKQMITSKIKLGDIVKKGFEKLIVPDCEEAKIIVSLE